MTSTIAPPTVADPAFDIVFLDRDGTLNTRLTGYVTRPAELVLLPGAGAAVQALNRSGARVVVVTNQRGLATGVMNEDQLRQVHAELDTRLAESGAHLDAIYVCPHEKDTCRCRKPEPGLFEQALAAAPWADPARCVMVGDMVSDVEPAAGLGMRTILLGTGPGSRWETAGSLPDAVERLLGSTRRPPLG